MVFWRPNYQSCFRRFCESDLLTSLWLQKLGQELVGGTLKLRRHLVRIIELPGGPIPDSLHIVGDAIRVTQAVLGGFGGLIGLW